MWDTAPRQSAAVFFHKGYEQQIGDIRPPILNSWSMRRHNG
jgi:hypothetical protein